LRYFHYFQPSHNNEKKWGEVEELEREHTYLPQPEYEPYSFALQTIEVEYQAKGPQQSRGEVTDPLEVTALVNNLSRCWRFVGSGGLGL
jgi:hypothetical protein